MASRSKDFKSVKALLNGKASVHVRSYALQRFHTPEYKKRCYEHSQPRIEPRCSYTPLHGWAQLDKSYHSSAGGTELDLIDVLDLLVAAGCDIDALDHLGRTALFGWNNFSYGVKQQQEVFVSSLLRHGADPTVLDLSGSSVLHSMHGYKKELEAVQSLIDAGANINQVRKSDGRTPLINATQVSQLMDPSIFKDLGAEFDVQDHSGDTAFHYACSSWCMSEDSVTIWLSLANPNIQNSAGRLALTNFAWGNDGTGRVGAISKMVELGVDLETRE